MTGADEVAMNDVLVVLDELVRFSINPLFSRLSNLYKEHVETMELELAGTTLGRITKAIQRYDGPSVPIIEEMETFVSESRDELSVLEGMER